MTITPRCPPSSIFRVYGLRGGVESDLTCPLPGRPADLECVCWGGADSESLACGAGLTDGDLTCPAVRQIWGDNLQPEDWPDQHTLAKQQQEQLEERRHKQEQER